MLCYLLPSIGSQEYYKFINCETTVNTSGQTGPHGPCTNLWRILLAKSSRKLLSRKSVRFLSREKINTAKISADDRDGYFNMEHIQILCPGGTPILLLGFPIQHRITEGYTIHQARKMQKPCRQFLSLWHPPAMYFQLFSAFPQKHRNRRPRSKPYPATWSPKKN